MTDKETERLYKEITDYAFSQAWSQEEMANFISEALNDGPAFIKTEHGEIGVSIEQIPKKHVIVIDPVSETSEGSSNVES